MPAWTVLQKEHPWAGGSSARQSLLDSQSICSFVILLYIHSTKISLAVISLKVLLLVVQIQREIKQKTKVTKNFSLSERSPWSIHKIFSSLILWLARSWTCNSYSSPGWLHRCYEISDPLTLRQLKNLMAKQNQGPRQQQNPAQREIAFAHWLVLQNLTLRVWSSLWESLSSWVYW